MAAVCVSHSCVNQALSVSGVYRGPCCYVNQALSVSRV